MPNLSSDLEILHELTALRERAKWLRKSGLFSLKGIEEIDSNGVINKTDGKNKSFYERWLAHGDEIEAALLVKVQTHKDISDPDDDDSIEAPRLKNKLEKITLTTLFPSTKKTFEVIEDDDTEFAVIKVYKKLLKGGDDQSVSARFIDSVDTTVPVLVAARVMQSLVARSKTVFSEAALYCYYRIISELYAASNPDWTIGAAKANVRGSASAFITGECIRAILSFENAINRTVEFFRHTYELLEKYTDLKAMLKCIDDEPEAKHPLSIWADKAIERMWLDWYISTHRGEIALYCEPPVGPVLPPPPPAEINMKYAGEYLDSLGKKLEESAKYARGEMLKAEVKISEYWKTQNPYEENGAQVDDQKERRKEVTEEEERRYQQTESAHQLAFRAIKRGIRETGVAVKFIKDKSDLTDILKHSIDRFEDISHSIHRILEPAKRYVRSVVNRELANAVTGRFDAGELAFAAASYGATTGWKQNERLTRACDLLIKDLPDSGSLPTKRPFHSTPRGYRLLPIGCEITRSFAQLLQKTNYEFEPKLVSRMLNIFEDKLLDLSLSSQSDKLVGWNFEGAPNSDKPSVWVTAVAVLSLDRIVRMLNQRINTIVLKHFEVIRPERPHTNLMLNDLIYPDYGLTEYFTAAPSIAIRLEQLRAHVMRAALPKNYQAAEGNEKKITSIILYGPPGTGKTTLPESLALSSNVPLIRLSPSDLTVQGQELIEGRARGVFEALSMLTQAVIILDEFEPVLASRDPQQGDSKANDPTFNFLLTGMLPKLVKLNEATKKQSLVYFLATNHIEKIDKAAKRRGRFDLAARIDHPDPLTRAGAFLYRLNRYKDQNDNVSLQQDERKEIFLQIVAGTANMAMVDLAREFYKGSVSFKYYLEGVRRDTNLKDLEPPVGAASSTEKERLDKLHEWEKEIRSDLKKNKGKIDDRIILDSLTR